MQLLLFWSCVHKYPKWHSVYLYKGLVISYVILSWAALRIWSDNVPLLELYCPLAYPAYISLSVWDPSIPRRSVCSWLIKYIKPQCWKSPCTWSSATISENCPHPTLSNPNEGWFDLMWHVKLLYRLFIKDPSTVYWIS